MTSEYGDVRVLILAGGSGTRLWPLSTDSVPKPFLPLTGNKTLLEETARRALALVPVSSVYFSARESHVSLLQSTFPEWSRNQFLLEPERRNTAPALGLSVLTLADENPESILIVLPSDQAIQDEATFEAALRMAVDAARQEGVFVTLGIPPTRPETGFGYLEASSADAELPVRRVVRFVEKPGKEVAEAYIASGCFLWNAGIFVFRIRTLLDAMKVHCPDILDAVTEAHQKRKEGDDQGFRSAFSKARKTSIDYAVMERVGQVLTVPASCGWSDLGSWDAVWDFRKESVASNVLQGPAEAAGCSGCLVIAQERPVTLLGLTDVVVIDSPQGLLVTRRGASDLLREYVEARLARREG